YGPAGRPARARRAGPGPEPRRPALTDPQPHRIPQPLRGPRTGPAAGCQPDRTAGPASPGRGRGGPRGACLPGGADLLEGRSRGGLRGRAGLQRAPRCPGLSGDAGVARGRRRGPLGRHRRGRLRPRAGAAVGGTTTGMHPAPAVGLTETPGFILILPSGRKRRPSAKGFAMPSVLRFRGRLVPPPLTRKTGVLAAVAVLVILLGCMSISIGKFTGTGTCTEADGVFCQEGEATLAAGELR